MAIKCQKCGKDCRIGTEQVGFDSRNLPVIHRFSYCDDCMIKTDLDQPMYQDYKMTWINYNLGLVSLLLSIVGMCTITFFFLGVPLFILALVFGIKALKTGNVYRKSAICGIILSGFFLLLFVISVPQIMNNIASM